MKIESIDEAKITSRPALFKDPKTVRVRNYLNDAGKELIEKLAREAGITGLDIVPLDPL